MAQRAGPASAAGAGGGFCGCTSSSRTRRTGRPGRAVRSPTDTTTRLRRATRRSAGSSRRSAPTPRRRWSSSPSDHGEAFGEHGEVSHSLFVYDTTLRVPLVIAGPGVPARTRRRRPSRSWMSRRPCCGCWDSRLSTATGSISRRRSPAPTCPRAISTPSRLRRSSTSAGARCARCGRADSSTSTRRAPSCTTRRATRARTRDLSAADGPRTAGLRDRVSRYSGATLEPGRLPAADREALGRLQALGYASGSNRGTAGARPDPKDRRAIAARLSDDHLRRAAGPGARGRTATGPRATTRTTRRPIFGSATCSSSRIAAPRPSRS